ncbi:aliphatic sulfonate ABC transporter substrate-binding protein [Gluconacetobacter takamatsuzukensis]|uniref:Putative aliphatic sulfonates-binding protein n=1 Tax=Gluconacetobacter takamatsuzukensis TaxID=1286190 RepID=A0A7W4PPR1_9PROT|nr:aliphatic sulfonate ABC transporter substrate-binding protein [Gluconacetobacter takamatsuzukensis]MBB2205508.1 aliphatic sulfonate ABC transporter substrate-binding protein [Gluconacetobacter takamatsuzukensis]
MNRRTALFSAAMLLLGRGAGRAADAPAAVRIGWLKGASDLTLSKARGTIERALAAQGVATQWAGPFAAAAPAVQALAADAIDITVGGSTSSVAALAAGAPIALFAYQKMAAGAEAIVVKADAPITTIAQLAGRKVAVNKGGTGEYLLLRALETAGLDPARVKRVYLPPNTAAGAFDAGYVDAWATWDPYLTLALRDGHARILADGGAIRSDNAITTIASRNFVAHRPALLRIVLAALEEDNRWAVAHPDQAGAIWAAIMGLPPDTAPALGRNNAVPTHAPTAADVAQIARIADCYVANHIIAQRPDLASAIVEFPAAR